MSKLATGWRHRTSEASPDPIAAITSRANRTKKRRRQAWAFAGIMLVASWGKFRLPVGIAGVDPKRKGHANILFRQMLRRFKPPTWAKRYSANDASTSCWQ